MKPTHTIVNGLNRRQFGLGSLAVGAALAVGALPTAAQAAPVKIRIGWIRVPVSFGPMLLAKKDILKNYGKSYVSELTKFPHSPELCNAMYAGEIDFGPMNVTPLLHALSDPAKADLRIVGDGMQDGFPGYATNPLMVRKDGKIKKIADMKGKVMSTNQKGSPMEVAFRALAKRAGLEAEKDFTFAYGDQPTQLKFLTEGKADLISPVIPNNYKPQVTAVAETLFTQKDGLGITQLETNVARASFIQSNRAALVDFFEDMMIALRWYYDPKNHNEVVSIISGLNGQPPDGWDWTFTQRDQYRDPKLIPNLKALKGNWEVMKEVGLLDLDVVDPVKFADLSMVTEAAKRF